MRKIYLEGSGIIVNTGLPGELNKIFQKKLLELI